MKPSVLVTRKISATAESSESGKPSTLIVSPSSRQGRNAGDWIEWGKEGAFSARSIQEEN